MMTASLIFARFGVDESLIRQALTAPFVVVVIGQSYISNTELETTGLEDGAVNRAYSQCRSVSVFA